jgi:hypothetical protein
MRMATQLHCIPGAAHDLLDKPSRAKRNQSAASFDSSESIATIVTIIGDGRGACRAELAGTLGTSEWACAILVMRDAVGPLPFR